MSNAALWGPTAVTLGESPSAVGAPASPEAPGAPSETVAEVPSPHVMVVIRVVSSRATVQLLQWAPFTHAPPS